MVVTGPTKTSGISPDEILSLYRDRKNKNMRVLNAGAALRRVYDGDADIPLPELERSERTAVANLIQTGLDQHAQRIASVDPAMMFPPDKNTRIARSIANDRRMTVLAWHYMNKMGLKRRERARHLIGYASSPVYLRPGSDGIPVWEICDPLQTFPAPSPRSEMVPSDCIFAYRRSWKWVQGTYGIAMPRGRDGTPDTMLDILFYMDADEMVMVAVGKDPSAQDAPSPFQASGGSGGTPCQLLQRVPNLAQRPVAIIPGRITLGRLQGQFDQMIGMYETQGLLWAMDLQALKRSIFAETWLEGRPNENPQIIAQADPIQGDIGITEGGALQSFRVDPSVQTGNALDRLERAQRLGGGVPAELGGESGSNIRTARRGSQVLSAAVDYQIQEHQEILAASEEEENKAAIAVAKAYWPTTQRNLLVPFGDGQVTYTPTTTFERDTHRVFYPYSGTDTNGLVIEGEQRVGAGTLSKRSFMEIDPMVQDPEFEHERVVGEALEAAFLSSLQQQAADPNGPYQPIDLARITELVTEKRMALYEAVQKVHDEAAQRQAAAAAQQPGQPSPQPGLSQAGAPGTPQAATPTIQAPQPSQANLAALLGTLRKTQRGANVLPGGGAPPPPDMTGAG